MVKNSQKLSKKVSLVQNGHSSQKQFVQSKTVKNDQKMVKMVRKCQKQSITVKHSQKWSNTVNNGKTQSIQSKRSIGQKRSITVKNGQKFTKDNKGAG